MLFDWTVEESDTEWSRSSFSETGNWTELDFSRSCRSAVVMEIRLLRGPGILWRELRIPLRSSASTASPREECEPREQIADVPNSKHKVTFLYTIKSCFNMELGNHLRVRLLSLRLNELPTFDVWPEMVAFDLTAYVSDVAIPFGKSGLLMWDLHLRILRTQTLSFAFHDGHERSYRVPIQLPLVEYDHVQKKRLSSRTPSPRPSPRSSSGEVPTLSSKTRRFSIGVPKVEKQLSPRNTSSATIKVAVDFDISYDYEANVDYVTITRMSIDRCY